MNGQTRKTKIIFGFMSVFFILLISIGIGEALLRFSGRPTYLQKLTYVPFRIEPGGRYFSLDATLGYRALPGKFKITLPDGYQFETTQAKGGLRITHEGQEPELASPAKEGEVWIFGCSFTQGWSLNDRETFPWLIQERFKNTEIINFGVSGYGTVQSLLQFQDAVAEWKRRPRIVVLDYAYFHNIRNMFLRSRQREVLWWKTKEENEFVQPFAELDSKRNLVIQKAKFDYWVPPLVHYSMLIDYLDELYARVEQRFEDSESVTKALILRFRDVVKNSGSDFVLAEIAGSPRMQEFAELNGIPYVDISVSFSKNPKYMNLPHDVHPSALANKIYAQKLGDFLEPILEPKSNIQ